MNILLTLDYELFLNDITGTVQNCLINPTIELQKICDKYGLHYTVFVDAAYLCVLNEKRKDFKALDSDYKTVCENLKWIRGKGHDVELHIHPQWFFSEFKNDSWQLDWDHYSLADLTDEQAIRFFMKSKRHLEDLIGESVIIFRAGGYTLQGFDYVKAFRECGMVVDSSVLPGQKEITRTHRFDYNGVPMTPYRFLDNICKPEQQNGMFTELPISISKSIFLLNYLSTKKHYMSLDNNVNWGDGGDYVVSGLYRRLKKIAKSFALFKQPKATIDYQSFFFLGKVYKESLKREYLNIIGHPKNFSPASLQYFDEFVDRCLRNGDHFYTTKEFCSLDK